MNAPRVQSGTGLVCYARRFCTLIWSLCTCCVFLLAVALPLAARSATSNKNPDSFRWIDPVSDGQLWNAIQSAFHDELVPDVSNAGQDSLDVYRHKYLRRMGIIYHSALVFIGHRPAKVLTKKNQGDEYYSAFNFNTETHQKTKIEHAEWMWKMKFRPLATFGPDTVPDVTFTYLTCTECEPELVFAALQYEPAKSEWRIRSWGNGKDPWWAATDGLVVDVDVNNGGDTISFDCIYRVLRSKKAGFHDLTIRCKEVAYGDSGRTKIDDSTLLYSSSDGSFKSRSVSDPSEAAAFNARTCEQSSSSMLCKLPFYLTATSGQNPALSRMFPNPPKTARGLSAFRVLTPKMSITDLVRQCGSPDELGGSGIFIFVYHLDDGSLVVIGTTGTKAPILYANHVDANGKATPLIGRR